METIVWQQSVIRVWHGLPHKQGKFVGTAFFIDPRTLLTAEHVVRNREHGIYLEGIPGGGKEKIEPNQISCPLKDRDIAILKTSRSIDNVVPLNLTLQELVTGERVILAGYLDETQSLHIAKAEIAGHVSTIHSWRGDINISRGMSGGPVISQNENRLAGIIHARDVDTKLVYLIPIDVIREALENLGINYILGQTENNDEVVNIKDLHERLEAINKKIDTLIPNQIKDELENIDKQFIIVRNNLFTARKQYSIVVKALYRNSKLFNHYNDSQDENENFVADLNDFYTLIRHTIEADDPTILDEFAIDYPCENPSAMSGEMPEYVDVFLRIVNKWDEFMKKLQTAHQPEWSIATKPYWAYLATRIKNRIKTSK
jgi:hypothetical protein